VDFCEQMVKETNPGMWDKAQQAKAPYVQLHRYRSIADMMRVLNPFTGEFEARQKTSPEPAVPSPESKYRVSIKRMEALIAKLENVAEPRARAALVQLLQSVMSFHRVALERIREHLEQTDTTRKSGKGASGQCRLTVAWPSAC
jgi:hypothetical protein